MPVVVSRLVSAVDSTPLLRSRYLEDWWQPKEFIHVGWQTPDVCCSEQQCHTPTTSQLPQPSHTSCKCVPCLQLSQTGHAKCLLPAWESLCDWRSPAPRLDTSAWLRLTLMLQVSFGHQFYWLTFSFLSPVWCSSSPVQFPHSSVGAFQSESRSIAEGSSVRKSLRVNYIQMHATSQAHISNANATKNICCLPACHWDVWVCMYTHVF